MVLKTENLIDGKDIRRLLCVKTQLFNLWVRMGLIPAWQPLVREGEIYHGFGYPPETLELCQKIKAWRELGISYRDIRARLEAEKVKV